MTFLTERPITWRAKETTKETRISFPLVHSSFTVTSDNQTQTYWYNSLLFPFPWGFFLRYIAIMCIVYLLAVYEWKALKATLPYARCRPLQTLPYIVAHCHTLSCTSYTRTLSSNTLSYVVIHCRTLIIHLSYIVIHFIDCHTLSYTVIRLSYTCHTLSYTS